MERYADAVQHGLTNSGRWDVDSIALMRKPADWPCPLQFLGDYWDRMIGYPVAAARRHADLWHICDHGFAHAAALLPPERTVVTCHDLMLLRAVEGAAGFRGTRTSTIRFRWTVSYLRKVAHVICVSSATQADVVRLTGADPDRTTVIPNGVDVHFRPLAPERRQAVRRSLGYRDQDTVILSVSSGLRYKNALGALDCLAELRGRGVSALMLRSGRPLSQEERAHAERLGVNTWVKDMGLVSEDRLVELYNASDVVLHPSFWEGFGWPPLEGMACGTPVVVSTAASLVEIVGDAAPIADPSDSRALADAVQQVTDPRENGQWRDRSLARSKRFSWSTTLGAIEDVYDRVLERSSSPASAI